MTQLNLEFSYQAAANFTNREEYLNFRALWKQDYKQLSTDIRVKKIAFKDAQRHFATQRYTQENHKNYLAANRAVNDLRWDLIQMARKATEMISERHASKEKSHDQYLEQKETENGMA